MVGEPMPHPVGRAEKVGAVDLSQVLFDAAGHRHGQVDRLAAGHTQPLERRSADRDDVALGDTAASELQQHRPRSHPATGAVTLHEALPFERSHGARDRALGQPGGIGQLADGPRLLALDHEHEQLGRPVDRLGSCLH